MRKLILLLQVAKQNYQNYSTQLIDKAGLLHMKRTVDFCSHLQRIREIQDLFNGKKNIPIENTVTEEKKVVRTFLSSEDFTKTEE